MTIRKALREPLMVPVNLGRRRVPSTETYATNLPTYKIICTRLSVLSQESRKNLLKVVKG